MACFALTLLVSPGLGGGLSTVVLPLMEQPLSGTFLFGAEKIMKATVDHTLAIETLDGYMLSWCNPETKRYNVYFFVTWQSRGRWTVQSGLMFSGPRWVGSTILNILIPFSGPMWLFQLSLFLRLKGGKRRITSFTFKGMTQKLNIVLLLTTHWRELCHEATSSSKERWEM